MEPLKGPPPGFPPVGKLHTCRNCGLVGHLHRLCPHPVMSFGILCFRRGAAGAAAGAATAAVPEYLMIQRKDSLSFMEFIRGKYDVHDIAYITQLLSHMTMSERSLLLHSTFNELWNHVWYQAFLPRHTQEYFDARNKFESLVKGITTMGPMGPAYMNLESLIFNSKSDYSEPEWGFPKGRRRLREEDVDCAVREFCEETGFTKADLKLYAHIPPFEEIFFGTNQVLYRHVYYVAELVGDASRTIVVDPNNINQAREVRQVSWFPAAQVMQRIRAHNRERKALFRSANAIVERELVAGAANEASGSEPLALAQAHGHAAAPLPNLPFVAPPGMSSDGDSTFAKKEGTSGGYLRPDAVPWIPGERFVYGYSNYVLPNVGITPRFVE